MQFPACGNNTKEVNIKGVTVDVCKDGCGGLWFDNFEFKKFDEPHESAGEVLLDIPLNKNLKPDHTKKLKCPKCDDVVLMRRFFSVKRQVEVDECPGCGGIWLDAGELRTIRGLFESEQERHRAAEAYFDEIFGEDFKTLKAQDEQKLAWARKFANMFRFICPSYYIPGKQDWGAF